MFDGGFWNYIRSFFLILKRSLIAHRVALLILLVGVFFPLQIFGELAEEVWENEGGFSWDVPTLLAIHSKIGATQNNHNCWIAQPPINNAGPVLRAGFTDTLVTGIPIK
uniref:PAP2 superfamily protein n=1 Tax=Planktothrix pseudagardhii TaxID=132604 RepID=A0A9W4CSN9_9CYAN|nr:PAP2 superfamily protein [Planktothrix pseudagardhii]